jgi:hypothetical protein
MHFMLNALKAGAIYFSLVFAFGFAFGTLRTLVIAPVVGDLIAVALELPLLLAVSWIACGWVLQRIHLPSRSYYRISMGAFAFILLMVAELTMSKLLAGRDLASHFSLYRTLPVFIGLLGQIAFAVFPLIRTRHQVIRTANREKKS